LHNIIIIDLIAIFIAIMLRRKPTAITISAEDVAAFEGTRQQRSTMENTVTGVNQDGSAASDAPGAKMPDPNDELKPLPGDKARIVRSREERIGITQRG
jgi:Anaphase-promoting complex APC subunit CDC26